MQPQASTKSLIVGYFLICACVCVCMTYPALLQTDLKNLVATPYETEGSFGLSLDIDPKKTYFVFFNITDSQLSLFHVWSCAVMK